MSKLFQKLLWTLLVATVLCAGCEQMGVEKIASAGVPIVLQTSLRSDTRINTSEAGNKFEQGDQIRLLYAGTPYKMELKGGSWLNASDGFTPLLWQDGADAGKFEFAATHPFHATESAFALPADQSTPANITQAEYLVAPKILVKPGEPVRLTFERKIARMKIHIIFDSGITADEATIREVRLYSPASEYKNGVPSGSPLQITPYQLSEGKYCALVIPTSTQVSGQLFVEMVTAAGTTYTYTDIPAMKAGTSYTLNLTVRNNAFPEMTAGDVVAGAWDEKSLDDGDWKREVTFADGSIGYFTPGERVPLRAAFREWEKFTGWSADSNVEFENPLSASTSFVMPDKAVEITATYQPAPYKLIIRKPGVIVDARGGDLVDPNLTQETEQNYVRYYAVGDEVRINASTSATFSGWRKADYVDSDIYSVMANQGGGSSVNATWFKMPAYQVELIPHYKTTSEPYWVSEQTSKGWLEANFIERVNTAQDGTATIPGGTTFYRAFTPQEKRVILRALHVIEQTFANPPARRISINFAVFNAPVSGVGAATTPVAAMPAAGYDSPKSHWTAADFGGRAAGRKAYSSTIEAAWRDGLNITPYGPSGSFIGFRDGTVVFNHNDISGWYKGDDPNAIPSGYIDMEDVALHEIAHLVCYHSLNMRGDQLTALDVFISHISDPERINVHNGNMFSTDGGQAIIYDDFVKSYFGRYPEVSCREENKFDFGHLDSGLGVGIGAMYRAGGVALRRFSDFELAFFHQMGWRINPGAWKNPPTTTH